MSGKTPQQRTRDNLTARGFLVATVERRKSFPDRKKHRCVACGHDPQISVSVDLFGFADILAIHPESGQHLLVQTTSRNNHATRRTKILASMEAKLCLLAGIKILVQSWRLDTKINRWQLYEEWIGLEQFKSAPHYPNDVAGLLEIRRKERKPDLPPGTTLPYLPIRDADIPF